METFSALLAICAGNSPVNGEFPSQRPVTWSFDVFFDLRLNRRLSKQSWGWWFETPSWALWRQCYGSSGKLSNKHPQVTDHTKWRKRKHANPKLSLFTRLIHIPAFACIVRWLIHECIVWISRVTVIDAVLGNRNENTWWGPSLKNLVRQSVWGP